MTSKPKRGSAEYAMEKAAAAQQSALQKTKKARYLEVVDCLEKNDQTTTECRVLLVNMGLLQPLPGQVVAPPPGAKPKKTETADDGADAGVADCPGFNGVPYPAGVTEDIPEKVKFVKDFNQVWMCYFLEVMEPQVLSKHAIKALIPNKRRTISLADLQEIWEAMTGLDPETPLADGQRKLSVFLPEIVQRNLNNSRPMQSRTLPVDWLENGWYQIESCNDEALQVLSIADGKKIAIDHTLLNIPSSKKLQAFQLEKNFSRRRAALFETGGFHKRTLRELFVAAEMREKLKVKAEGEAKSEQKPACKEEAKQEGCARTASNEHMAAAVPGDLMSDMHDAPPPPPFAKKEEPASE